MCLGLKKKMVRQLFTNMSLDLCSLLRTKAEVILVKIVVYVVR